MSKKVPLIRPTNPTRPRNAFDLSQRHSFTAPAGALLPVLTLDLMPHDHVEIQATDFMRCLPMNSAAFLSMRGVYEFFAVPYSQLYHPIDQILTNMKDYKSSFFSRNEYKSSLSIPYFTWSNIDQELSEREHMQDEVDIFGYHRADNAKRLFDLLGYFNVREFDQTVDWSNTSLAEVLQKNGSLAFSPFRVLAYNKIYSDFYRNSTYESYDVESFNIDFIKPGSEMDSRYVLDLFELHYRNAPLDYLTNVRPSPLYNDNLTYPHLDDTIFYSSSSAGITDGNGFKETVITTDSDSQISVAGIRAAFALDKLSRITMRAGKTYAEQIAAHFGFNVSEGRDGSVQYLGGFDSNIQVGDVVQTSGTTVVNEKVNPKFGGYLGNVTGKAQGSGSGRITFDAKEHCILMCIYSLIPDMNYDSRRIDPFCTKIKRSDFFMPEFEDLGMQPLVGYNVNYNFGSDIIGFQPRYSEYKTALDINHGQFSLGAPLSYWTVSRGRREFADGKFDITSLKINPNWVDDIFAVNYNGKDTTDCVFGNCQFNIQKVSDMSDTGEPRV